MIENSTKNNTVKKHEKYEILWDKSDLQDQYTSENRTLLRRNKEKLTK